MWTVCKKNSQNRRKKVTKWACDQSCLLEVLKSYKLAEEPGLLNNEPVDLSDIPLAAEDNMCAEAHWVILNRDQSFTQNNVAGLE